MRDTQTMAGTVPLTLIAAELNVPVDTVLRRLSEHVGFDDAGLRCVSVEHAWSYISHVQTERRIAAEQQRRRMADLAAKGNPLRDRVRRLAKQQERLAEAPDGEGAAFARMLEADGSRDRELDRAARDRQELFSGATTYHRIQEED